VHHGGRYDRYSQSCEHCDTGYLGRYCEGMLCPLVIYIYRFLRSFSVTWICQLRIRQEIYYYLSQIAIKLKYDRLTCAICRRFLIRYSVLSPISNTRTVWELVIAKRFADKHYEIGTGHLGNHRRISSGVCIKWISLKCVGMWFYRLISSMSDVRIDILFEI
jgi:hypothetical protein